MLTGAKGTDPPFGHRMGGGGSDVSFVVFQLAALGLVIKLMKKWIRLRVKKGERAWRRAVASGR